jgi:hypothetical protein
LSLCVGLPCLSPLYSVALSVLKPIAVVLLSPPSGPTTGGRLITVYGSGFVNDATLQCVFGGTAVQAVFQSTTAATCTLPAADTIGATTFSLLLRGETVSTSIAQFRYYPALLSGVVVAPRRVSSLGGTNVSVLTPDLESLGDGPFYCRFDYKYVPAVAVNKTMMNCLSPPFDFPHLSFAISSNGADVSIPVELEVSSPAQVLLVDPMMLSPSSSSSSSPVNVSIFFDRALDSFTTPTCVFDERSIPSFVPPNSSVLICGISANESSGGYHNLSVEIGHAVVYSTQIFVPIRSSERSL